MKKDPKTKVFNKRVKEVKIDFDSLIVGNSLLNRGHAIFFNHLALIGAEIIRGALNRCSRGPAC